MLCVGQLDTSADTHSDKVSESQSSCSYKPLRATGDAKCWACSSPEFPQKAEDGQTQCAGCCNWKPETCLPSHRFKILLPLLVSLKVMLIGKRKESISPLNHCNALSQDSYKRWLYRWVPIGTETPKRSWIVRYGVIKKKKKENHTEHFSSSHYFSQCEICEPEIWQILIQMWGE